jgi:hypothetical protein
MTAQIRVTSSKVRLVVKKCGVGTIVVVGLAAGVGAAAAAASLEHAVSAAETLLI